MGQRTPLYDRHVRMGGKIVDFAGWEMPINYGSQIEEHHAVRRDAGMFDVSHMCVVDLTGTNTRAFLRKLLANNIDRVQAQGKALYSCMLNAHGGVIDDLIVYFMREDFFRMVVNAGTRDKDLAWLEQQARAFDVHVRARADLAMIAVQGPNARPHVLELLEPNLRENAAALEPFFATAVDENGAWFVSRTGYTGEEGFEVVLPAGDAAQLWDRLAERGVRPIGLGARDTLRLEAGMNLYGSDMTETTTPLESGLGWTIGWEPAERDFIGRAALEQQRAAGVPSKLVALLLEGKGVLRGHQAVMTSAGAGEITSGSFSPSLGRSIALARIPASAAGERCEVEIRGRLEPVRIVRLPFVRHGEIKVSL